MTHPTTFPPLGRRQLLKVAATGAATLSAPYAFAQNVTDVKFSLDWQFQGVHAWFLLAAEKGYFRQEGINIQIDVGDGSSGVVQRIIGGAYDAGIGDTNTVKQVASTSPATSPMVTYMVFNRAPFVIMSKKSANITKPADLAGKSVLSTANSSALRMFPTLARNGGLDASSVKFLNAAPQLLDQMLVRNDADALVGFLTTTWVNLKALGQNMNDYNMMFFTDYGVEAYGNSVLVSRKMAVEQPRVAAGLVRAINRAFNDVQANPTEGIDAVMRRSPILNREAEAERLSIGMSRLINSAESRSVGIGDVDSGRFERATRQIVDAFSLTRQPAMSEFFTRAFLPPRAERNIRAA